MISVIIPVYNSEKYLDRCLSSILNQSYKDIEVIVVNDGSTDSSKEICQKYDVKVIDSEHRGLSAARNIGIEHANGEWLMFLDSDDWVSEDFCRIPLEAANRYDADLVCFRRYDVDEEGRPLKSDYAVNRPSGAVTHEEAVDYGEIVVWNKLYRREMFNGIRFPEGYVFEDLFVTHNLIYRAERPVLLLDKLYYYRHRKGSLSSQRSKQFKTDAFEAYLTRYKELIGYGYPKDKAEKAVISPALGHRALMSDGDHLVKEAEEILESVNGMPDLPRKKKIMFCIWRFDRKLFDLICRAARVKY